MKLLLVLVFCIISILQPNANGITKHVVGIGAFGPDEVWTRNEMAVAQYACQQTSAKFLEPYGDKMECRYYDDDYETISIAIKQTLNALQNETFTDVILGTVFSSTSVPVAQLTATYGVPMISWQATSDRLSDKFLYPLFSRVVPPDSFQGSALARVMAKFKFSRLAILATNENYGLGLSSSFSASCHKLGISIVASQTIDASIPSEDLHNALSFFQAADARIIALFGNFDPAQLILQGANAMEMTGQEYLWVGTDGSMAMTPFPLGSIGSNLYTNTNTLKFSSFSQVLQSLPGTIWNDEYQVNGLEAALYDAHETAARAMNHSNHIVRACEKNLRANFCTLWTDICQDRNDTLICFELTNACVHGNSSSVFCLKITTRSDSYRLLLNDVIRHVRFDGMSGRVQLDENGDNVGYYSIINQIQVPSSVSQNTTSVANIGLVDASMKVILFDENRIVWPGIHSNPPLDHRGIRKDEAVAVEKNRSIQTLSFLMTAIGSWVSMILLEQAIGAQRDRLTRPAMFWIVSSGISLGLGFWACMSMFVISHSFSSLPNVNNVVTLRSDQLFGSLAILVSSACVLLGFVLFRVDYKQDSSKDGDSNSTISTSFDSLASVRKLVISDTLVSSKNQGKLKKKRFFRMTASEGFSIFLAGTLWSQVCFWTNMILSTSIVLPCEISVNPGWASLGSILAIFPSIVAFWMFYFWTKTQWRFTSAIVMMIVSLFLNLTVERGTMYFYLGDDYHPPLFSVENFETVLTVTTSVFSAAAGIGIVLNSTKLRSSRESLNTYVVQMNKKFSHEQEKSRVAEARRINQLLVQKLAMEITPPIRGLQSKNSKLAKMWETRDVSVKFTIVSRNELTLQHVLTSSLALPILKCVAVERKTPENILFLIAVSEFSKEVNGELRLKMAREIKNTYFVKEKDNMNMRLSKKSMGLDFGESLDDEKFLHVEKHFTTEINIDSKLFDKQVQAIKLAGKDCPTDLFKDSYAEVLNLVQNNEWNSHIQTSDLLDLCLLCVNMERYLENKARL